MADNYLERRYDEVFGKQATTAPKPALHPGHSLDALLLRNRSCRGYDKAFIVSREMLQRIIAVNAKTPSARNQQVLRFRPITRGPEADEVLRHIRMGGALPELHLPLAGTEPEAFIIVCSTVPENRNVDIDLGISLQSMLLKATDMGLNGLIICSFDKEAISHALCLPYAPLAVVAIGKGAEQIRLVPIKETESHAYYRQDGIHCVPKVQVSDLLI